MSGKTSLALIVPCYNESLSIPFFEAELSKFQSTFQTRMPDSQLSVIVVDNNSVDGSKAMLAEVSTRLGFVRVESCKTQGYGAALKHGFTLASAEYFSFLDLDNTYPLESLLDMLHLIQSKQQDIVYGARIHENSEISMVRKCGNLLYVYLLKIFFNSQLSDVCSGMRVFRSELKNEILSLPANDLSFSIELTAHAVLKKWQIAELAVSYRDRVGVSKLSVVKDGFLFLFVILRQALRKR